MRPCSCNRVTRSTAFSAVPNAACRAQLNVCDAETDSATAAEEAEPADESEFAHNTEGFSVEDEDAPPLPTVQISLSNWSIKAVRQLHMCGLLAVGPPNHALHSAGGKKCCLDCHTLFDLYAQEEDAEARVAAEAAAVTDAADLLPEELAPGDGSATDRDLEVVVGPACQPGHTTVT